MTAAVLSSHCRAKKSKAVVCVSTLLHVSDTWEKTRPRLGKVNEWLSPWSYNHSLAIVEAAQARRSGTTKIKRENSLVWFATQRDDSAQASRKKSARFRGALNTVLSAERRKPVEPGFQHFDDIGEYIEQYRALRYNLCPRPSWTQQASDLESGSATNIASDGNTCPRKPLPSKGCTRRHDPPAHNPSIKTTPSDQPSQHGDHVPGKTGDSEKPKQRSHRTSNNDKTRSNQSQRPSHQVNHVDFPSKMAVRGNQMNSNKNNICGERGRRRPQYGGLTGRKHHPPPRSHRCRRIYLTWRQYRKYFSTQNVEKGQGKEWETGEDPDEDEGYVERSTTPAPTMPQRAKTCVPVLDFDQSRVATPSSPFQVDSQSARGKQSKSAVSGSTPTATREKLQRPQTETASCLNRREKTWHGQNSFSRQRSALVGSGRPRLTICTAVDIEEAVKELAETLGNKKPLTKPSGAQ